MNPYYQANKPGKQISGHGIVATCGLILLLLLLGLSLFGQCEPYRYGPYAKKEIYIAPAFALVGTFIAVELVTGSGATVKQRDLTAFTGMMVTTGVMYIDFKVKQNRRRREVRRIYGDN